MTNPFDNAELKFLILINAEKQYSLWPDFASIPAGWAIFSGPDSREVCVKRIEDIWVDMRQESLVQAMAQSST